LIVAVSISSAIIEIYGFIKDRTSKDEIKPVRNANQTNTGPGSIQQQFESSEGPHTNVAGGVKGDVLSGKFNGPAAAGGDAVDMRDSIGSINKPSGPVNQHFGDEITQIFKSNEPLPVPRIQSPPQDFVGRIDELRNLLANFGLCI